MKFDKAKWDALKQGKYGHHTERMEKSLSKRSSKTGRQVAAVGAALSCATDEFATNGFDGLRGGLQEVLSNWDNWMAAIEEGIVTQ